MVFSFLKKLFEIKVTYEILEDNGQYYLRVYIPKSIVPKEIYFPKLGKINTSILSYDPKVRKLANKILNDVAKKLGYKEAEFQYLEVTDKEIILWGKIKK